jgi:hypothetical protein
MGLLVAVALLVGALVSPMAQAQDQEPLPAGVPSWNWQQLLTSPVTVWACKKRVERRNKPAWRVNFVARSKETEWQTAASARMVRHPRKRTIDDWSSGVLEPGAVSRVGRVVGDVDNNDKITIGAGHRNGPYAGAGLGDTMTIRDIKRC